MASERGEADVRAVVREVERALRKPQAAEEKVRAAAAAHESKSDKSLRPGSPEWRQAVARRSGR
jgi:hypothetical protein